MIAVDVRLDIKGMLADVGMSQKLIRAAASRAINKAANSTATMAGREISKRTKLPSRQVRSRIQIRGAKARDLYAAIYARPFSPNLGKFGRASQNKRGVAATAWEGRKTYRGAFIMPSGRVVSRVGNGRFPLKGLRGPSVPKTFVLDDVMTRLVNEARAKFGMEFARQVALKSSAFTDGAFVGPPQP